MSNKSRIYLIALFTLAILVRLAVAPLWGHGYDTKTFIDWAQAIQQFGWLRVYQTSNANYPPLGAALIGFSGWLETFASSGDSLAVWRLLIKLPAIAADMGIAALVWHLAKGRKGAILLVASVLFNPALFYLSAVWGQVDAIYGLAVFVSLWLALENRPLWAGLCLGIGAMLKLQALIAAPLIGLAAVATVYQQVSAEEGRPVPLKSLMGQMPKLVALLGVGFALPILVSFAPFVIAGQGLGWIRPLVTLPQAGSGWLTVNAHNLWFLITGGAGNRAIGGMRSGMPGAQGSRPFVSGSTYGPGYAMLGYFLLLIWAIVISGLAWLSRRARAFWFLNAALLYLGFFYFMTGMTERYSFAAVIMLSGAAALSLPGSKRRCDWTVMVMFGALSILITLNLVWAAPALSSLRGWYANNTTVGIAVALGYAVVMLGGILHVIYGHLKENLMVPETLPNQPTTGNTTWLDRRLWGRITPALLLLVSIMLLSTTLHFINIGTIGDSNAYYTAAAESMTQSWHNFFFVAAEPGGSVTIDKPPLGLWIEAAFAFVLGVSGFSTTLPNILAGIFGIPILYYLVRKYLGSGAGLIASLVFTLTPTVLGTDRNNTMDGMLVFCLLLAAWAFVKATESGKLRWLLLGGFIVGLGFNIKMLQAFLPLPAFYALYFFGSRVKWWRKILNLGMATVLLLVVSLSWAIAVDLTPADQRPYVGSSTDNTVMELIVGHNGLNRLFGGARGRQAAAQPPADGPDGFAPNQSPDGPQPPQEAISACNGLADGVSCTVNLANGATVSGTCAQVQGFLSCEPANRPPAQQTGQAPGQGAQSGASSMFSSEVGTPSAIRFFIPPLAKEMSWLLPFALFSLLLSIFAARLSWPFGAAHKSLVLWGGWLVTCLGFFSVAGFFHDYYMIMLAPALGAVIGGGVQALWQWRERAWTGWVLALMAIPTLALQWWLAVQFGQSAWWLWVAALLMVAGLAGLVLSSRPFQRVAPSTAYALIVAAILVVPLAWSILTVAEASPDVNLPGAYSGEQAGGPSNPQAAAPAPAGNNTRSANTNLASGNRQQVDSALLEYLQANTQDVEYLVAVPNANSGATYVLATGRPVLYMGGFSGGDAVVDAADLAEMVANGKLRYVLYTGDRNPKQDIARWLQSSCTVVPGFGTGQIAATPAQQRNVATGQGTLPQDGTNQVGGRMLYQCSGSLAPYESNQAIRGNNPPQGVGAAGQSSPPQEALDACAGLSIGQPCAVSLPNGNKVDGSCRRVQGQLACVPAR